MKEYGKKLVLLRGDKTQAEIAEYYNCSVEEIFFGKNVTKKDIWQL